MTVFITRLCKRLSLALLAGVLIAAHPVMAAGITIERAELVPSEEAYQLNAAFDIDFSPEVEEAVNKGVALTFLVEFALMEERKYWFDEEVTSASLAMRLSYHALSRQYLVNIGSHQSTFASLEDALQALGNLQNWPVVEKNQLKKGVSYYAMLRMRLDHGRLPKPLQVSAIGSEEWNLVSERHRWVPVFDKPDKSVPDKPQDK
ncbi:MAG: DUF4390 domain-containing protein [Methylophilaceae bacterium]|nr:DUF4390 domain-containing protein [Methylophilaceae bacterium]